MARCERFSCCLSFDFDGMASWTVAMRSTNRSEISRGEYGATVGMPRVLNFLKTHKIQATFFVPGQVALCYPSLVKRAADEGHEIGHHGWAHENPSDKSMVDERSDLERGIDAIARVAGVRPVGYRSPSWDVSHHTFALLRELGFQYDSSCMASDYRPYYVREGDAWNSDGGYDFGTLVDLVEVPVYWGLDDAAMFEFVPNRQEGLASPSAIEEIWRGDFDYGRSNEPGGLLNLTLHPHVIARGHRMLMLDRLIQHCSSFEETRFTTLGDFVRGWKERNALDAWSAANPLFVDPKLA